MSDLALLVYKEWEHKIEKGLTFMDKLQLDKCLKEHGLTFPEIFERF